MDYRSARYLCTALSELSQGNVETLHMKGYFLFGLLSALSWRKLALRFISAPSHFVVIYLMYFQLIPDP